jgi:asparagine synthase (glutamine-hydrolysing)
MVADVPLGAFLSGGIDSSLVVALMQAQSSRRVRTFTIGFEEAAYNEAGHAMAVAQHLGTDHTELYVTPQQARDVIPQLPDLYCEPFADSSQIPTYLVSMLARRHVTVSLSGDAGDELFAGYSRYGWALERWNRLARVPAMLRSALAAGMGAASRSGLARSLNLRRAMQVERAAPVLGAATLDEIYLHLFSHLREPLRWVKGATPLKTAFDSVPAATAALDELQRLMALDTVTYLPDDVLTKVDRAAMAASLETRVPFLDHRFVEFAWTLPTHYKVRDGRTKWPLRQVLYRHVPRELIERPKKGFGVPINQWLRGPLRDWADGLLDHRRLDQQGLLQAAPITELWRQHRDGVADWSLQLWNVLMLQAWLDRHGGRTAMR